jgi:2-keto-4-pentenoate hydratase/2-oxohepta-3-ene-1,7-dioic acid hydratase in catechol pathway
MKCYKLSLEMKIIRFKLGRSTHYGIIENGSVFSLEGKLFGSFHAGKYLCEVSDVRLLTPIQPSIVVGVGSNYPKSAIEADDNMLSEPQVFLKPRSAVVGHLDSIIYPKMSNDIRCGAELAVVIGRKAIHVPEDRALDYVLGYTCALDVTAFDIAERDTFVTRAKSFYSFCSLGPWINTKVDFSDLKIACRQNGALKQQGSTSEMVFGIAHIISHVSEFMALEPGEVILTGTVEGGSFRIEVGDVVEVEIEGIGSLRNTVVSE